MSKRLEILERSLAKKNAKFDAAFEAHRADVVGAQGEPMAGHSGGERVLRRWERQSAGLKSLVAGIEKTERAIEIERGKISESAVAMGAMPQAIADLVEAGTLIQWRKHPATFFVDGVDKARIQFKGGVLSHKYSRSVTDPVQSQKFKEVFNGLHIAINGDGGV